MSDSLFNKGTGLYPTTFLKDKIPIQVFSDAFWEIFKTFVLQNTSRRLFQFYRKIFYK